MNKIDFKKKLAFDRKEIIKGLIISIVLLIATLLGLVIGTNKVTITIVQFVLQAGVTLIWLFAKWGAFSSTGKEMYQLGSSIRNSKENKLGTYRTPKIVEKKVQKSKETNYSSIILMATISLIELIAYILVSKV